MAVIPPQKLELVIYGFIRHNELLFALVIPEDLKSIVLLFYPNRIAYHGTFLPPNAGPAITIEDDGHTIGGYRSAKLDQPLPTRIDGDMSLIYRWKAVTSADSSYWGLFGVVSNQCCNFHAYPFTLKEAYGISMKSQTVYVNGTEKDEEKYKGFEADEVIVIDYEIKERDRCSLTFYKDNSEQDAPIWHMTLPSKQEITAWYPVFSQSNTGKTTQFIPL